MNRSKYRFVVILLAAIAVLSYAFTFFYLKGSSKGTKDDDGLVVVTSFFPVYTAALNVFDGVDSVTLNNLSQPQTGCLHDYQLTPGDLKLLETADVFIVNGGGIESFLQDVAEANPDMNIINISEDLELIQEENEINAHGWMSIKLYKKQVQAMADAIETIDPKNATSYEDNTKEYLSKLDELLDYEEEVKKAIAENRAESERNVIILQEAFEYFADELGLEVAYVMDMDEERQVSAGEVSDAIAAVKENKAITILSDDIYGKELANTVSNETGARVCIISPLVRGDYHKDSYIDGMKENLRNMLETQ